jgi:hypothetical protein
VGRREDVIVYVLSWHGAFNKIVPQRLEKNTKIFEPAQL